MSDPLTKFSKDFTIECSQINLWCEILNDMSLQIGTLSKTSNKESNYLQIIQQRFVDKMSEFISNISPFSKEPSNLYKLLITLSNILDLTIKYILNCSENLERIISSNSQKIVDNIDTFRNTVLISSQKIMNEVLELKTKTLTIQDTYNKLKSDLEKLQIEKKKIENDPDTAYNDTLKEKTNNKIIALMQEIEEIVPRMKSCIVALDMKKKSFNSFMRDTFELVVINTFKGVVYLHQFFFLICKEFFDANCELKKLLNEKLNSHYSNSLVINDFTERKFAMLNGINYEPIHFCNEFLDTNCDEHHEDDQNVLALCDSYIYYTETFVKCMKIRKKLVEFLSMFISVLSSDSNQRSNEMTGKLHKRINDLIKNINSMGQGTKRIWNTFLQFISNSNLLHNSIVNFFSATTLEILNRYIKESKEDYLKFEQQWMKYSKKIKEYRDYFSKLEADNQTNKLNGKGRDLKKEEKLKKYLSKDCTDFLKKNIKAIRERERKRANDIYSINQNIFKFFQKNIEETIEITQNEIENVSSLDLYEEINKMFAFYFEKYKIENYENFMETIKLKVLTKIDFEQENIGQTTRNYLNGYYAGNSLNISNTMLNYSEASFLSGDEIGEVNKEQEKVENEDIEDENEKIKFVEDKNFEVVKSKNINPYQNFKEKELKEFMTKLKNDEQNKETPTNYIDNKIELGENEQLISSFICKLMREKGDLYITNMKIIFYTKRQKISIPFEDVTSVTKSDDKQNPYSILVKTTKASLLFSSFVEREKCLSCINEQLELIKKNSNENEPNDSNPGDSLKGKSKIQMINRNIAIKSMLEKINFISRLKEITNERLKAFEEINKNDKFSFIPENEFEVNYITENDLKIKTPLSLIFHYIFNPTTQIESHPNQKSFYENIYQTRGDINIRLTYNEEQNEKIPHYFSDLDYSLDLFSNFDENELTSFLEEINTWEKKISFELNFVHPIKKMIIGPDRVTMKDIITVYFISPTDLIIDYHSYGSDFPYIDTFVSISQYRFHTDILFNDKKGRFDFKTQCKVNYLIKMVKSCFLESKLKSEGYKTNRDEIIYKVFEPMKDLLATESESFYDMYIKVFEDNIRRTLHNYSDKLPEGYNIEEENKTENINANANTKLEIETITTEKANDISPKEEVKTEIKEKDDKKDNNTVYKCLIGIIVVLIIKMLFQTNNSQNNGKSVFCFDNVVNLCILIIVGYLFVKVNNSYK